MKSKARIFFGYGAILIGYYLAGILLWYTLIVNILSDRTIFFSIEKGGYYYFTVYAFFTTLILLYLLLNRNIHLKLGKGYLIISLLFFLTLWTFISIWDVKYNLGSYESTCQVLSKNGLRPKEVFCYKYYKDSDRYFYYGKLAFSILVISLLYNYSKNKKN